MLIKVQDFYDVLYDCSERFRPRDGSYFLIQAALSAVREMILAGGANYDSGDSYNFLAHNAYGFRILASTVLAMMIKKVAEEKGISLEFSINGIVPSREGMARALRKLEECELMNKIAESEPALKRWSDIFGIPFSIDINPNIFYYKK